MLAYSWRYTYFLSIGLRFVLALSNSYIHPDEHFQSFEALAGQFFHYDVNVPWEYSSAAPARSFAPLMLIYYPAMKLAAWIGLLPLQTLYLLRLELMVVSWMVTDWCLHRMLPTKQERIKAIFFVLTSYVTLVHQLHTFSNSVETVLLVLTVHMLNELRFLRTLSSQKYTTSEICALGAGIGACVSLGVFNRVTFPAFLLLPAWIFVQSAWKWKFLPFVTVLSFAVTAVVCVVTDTIVFKNVTLDELLESPFAWSQYVVTPLNNLVYNTKLENLQQHGLHPFYTHALVNLPQIMGPGLIFLGYKNRYWRTTPFLAAASGLLVLSLVPHQELRFLIPMAPLLCCCFDVTAFLKITEKYPYVFNVVLNSWLAFNAIMALLMGVLHQGGVVPATDYLYTANHTPCTLIWWRTYSPPTWMLGYQGNSTQFLTINDENLGFEIDKGKSNLVFDTMGTEFEHLRAVFDAVPKHSETYLITPIASFNTNFNSSDFELAWSYSWHLDMDHLDFGNWASLQPGLGIYRLL